MVSPGRGTPGICLIGMCRPKRYGFCSVLLRFGSDYRIRECMNVFVVSIQMKMKERVISEFEMDCKKSFC